MSTDYDQILDATQDECPVPTIRAKEALDALASGEILKLVTSAEGTVRNIRTFTSNNHCELIHESRVEEGFQFLIRKL